MRGQLSEAELSMSERELTARAELWVAARTTGGATPGVGVDWIYFPFFPHLSSFVTLIAIVLLTYFEILRKALRALVCSSGSENDQCNML